MKGFLGVLSVLAVLLIYSETCSAISCYECNSKLRGDCGDEFKVTEHTKKYKTDCGANVTSCRKIIQEVYIINDWENMKGDWDERIVRQCAPTPGKMECVDRTGTYRVKIKYCHCQGENCNGSSNIQISFVAVIASVLMSIGIFTKKFL